VRGRESKGRRFWLSDFGVWEALHRRGEAEENVPGKAAGLATIYAGILSVDDISLDFGIKNIICTS
jgi:hypothetical protein